MGFLLKYRGANEAPEVEWARPIRSSLALLRSRWYAIGMLVAVGSWGLHVAALSLAPISIVQSIIAGGLVLVTILADRVFGLDVSRREWIGVACMAAGLAFLAATIEHKTVDSAHASWDAGVLAAYVGGATLVGTVLLPIARRSRVEGILLGASAGALWGASDIAIKALSGRTHDLGAGVLLHPLALVILFLSLYGVLVSGRSLQVGEAVPVIAVTSAVANILTIASGPIVFDEPLPHAPLALAVRMLAFVLVIAATVLTPPPLETPSTA